MLHIPTFLSGTKDTFRVGNSPVYIGFFSMCLPSTSVVPSPRLRVTPDRRGANHAVHAVHATGEKKVRPCAGAFWLSILPGARDV